MKPRPSLAALVIIASSLFASAFITSVHATGCVTTCQFEADTNVPSSQATVWVRADGGTPYRMNHTFSFANGTQHTVEVLNTTLYAPSTGARYVFKQWIYPRGQWGTSPRITTPNMLVNWTSTQDGPFVAEFDKQYQLSLSFTDPNGEPIVAPSSVTLQSGASAVPLASFTNNWLSATTWAVTDATWENYPGLVFGTPLIDLRGGSVSASVPLKAYPATVRVVDNSNHTISGATVTITFVNSTSKTFTTDTQGNAQLGHVPLGPYSIHIVYQNLNVGPYEADASVSQVTTITIGLGGGLTSGPVVSALVLLTIFGVATFLLVLAIKVRKPPPPPAI